LYARLPILIVRYKTRKHRSISDLALLGTFPSIWVGQDKVYMILDRNPKISTISMSFLNICPRALVKILHEVSKNFDCRFVVGKRRNVAVVDLGERQVFWTKMKFPPIVLVV